MNWRLPVALVFIVLIFSHRTTAQTRPEDSSIFQSALARTTSVYLDQRGDQSVLYNGFKYTEYPFSFREGSPYFMTNKETKGSVVYDSILFSDVPLLYDDYRAALIFIDQNFKMQLVDERISAFTILDHQFIKIHLDSSTKGLPENGFYEQLYPGRTQVLKYSSKKEREVLVVGENDVHYLDETDNFYLKSGNHWKHITSRSELFSVLKDRKKEIQKFIKKNNLNYRKDRDNMLSQVAAYYDQAAD